VRIFTPKYGAMDEAKPKKIGIFRLNLWPSDSPVEEYAEHDRLYIFATCN